MRCRNRVLAVVPARSGSKGLPGKNLRPFCGEPLIVHSIRQGLESHQVDHVIVSTDSSEIQLIAKASGADSPFLRPALLANDSATSADVAIHAIDYMTSIGKQFDVLVLLEPTSPLRTPSDVDLVINFLKDNWERYDAAVTMGEVHFGPDSLFSLDGNQATRLFDQGPIPTSRQAQSPSYFPFGLAYCIKIPVLLSGRSFYPKRTAGVKVDKRKCVEIDDIYDFVQAEALANYSREARTP